MSTQNENWSMKKLWLVLSGRSQPASVDIVGPALEKSKNVILENLFSLSKLPTVQSQNADKTFVERLAKLTKVSENVASHVVDQFHKHEFQGTEDEWTSNQKHLQENIVLEIWKLYLSERNYLLHCVQTVVENRSSDRHPYQELFSSFVSAYNTKDVIKERLIEQLVALTEARPPTELPESLLQSSVTATWWNFNLRERIILLQTLIVHSRTPENSLNSQDFLKVLQTCASVAKLPKQFSELDSLQQELWYLTCVLLLKSVDLSNRTKNPFISQRELQKSVENELNRATNFPELSPLLLAWMLMHEDQQSANKFRRFGEEAMRHRVLNVISNMANDPIFKGTSAVGNVAFAVLNEIVSSLLAHFDVERLGGSDVHSAAVALFKNYAIAHEFWENGTENGLGIVWGEAIVQFPESFTSLVEMAKSLAVSGEKNLSKLTQALHSLPYYVDSLDNIPAEYVIEHNGRLELRRPYHPYGHAGHKGFLVPSVAVGETEYAKKVRWAARFSLWDAVVGECKSLIYQANLGPSAVQRQTLIRVQKSLPLLGLVLKHLLSHYRGLEVAIRETLLELVETCCSSNFPLDGVLASSMECLATLGTVSDSLALAARLSASGLFPAVRKHFVEGEESKLVLTSIGTVGSTLTRKETTQGFFPVTKAFIKLATCFAEAELEDVVVPCGLYIVQEIFPYYMLWNYVSVEERDQMIDCCLTFARRIFDPNRTKAALQNLFVRIFLDNRKGEVDHLLHIATTGYRFIEARIMEQTNWEASEGPGLCALRQMRLSLSILNSLLSHKETLKFGGKSNLETALATQPAARNVPHFVVILCEYAHFSFDPQLATLALRILRRCAAHWSMSISACLGSKAQVVREKWLEVISSPHEDARLQQSLLGLFAEAVSKQPGLIHLLISGEDASRFFSSLIKLLDSESVLLRVATLQLVQSLWVSACSPAVDFFSKEEGFWNKVVAPLLSANKNNQLNPAPYSMRILATEICATGGKVKGPLQPLVQQLLSKEHLVEWSTVILELLSKGEGQNPVGEPIEYELLNSWRDFVVVMSHFGPKLSADQCSRISGDVVEALLLQIRTKKHKLVIVLSEFYLMLLRAWKGNNMAPSTSDWIKSIGELLAAVAEADITSLPHRSQASVLAIAIDALRKVPNRHSNEIQTETVSWIRPAGSCLQSCLIQLSAFFNSSETSPAVCSIAALAVSLVQQLAATLASSANCDWFSVLQENFLIQCALSTAQMAVQFQRAPEVVESILGFLIVLAETKIGSMTLLSLNLGVHLCLPLAGIPSTESDWTRTLQLTFQLYNVLLEQQGHFFLPEAMTLVEVHQERLSLSFNSLRTNLKAKSVQVALDVMALLHRLSKFEQSWRLEHSKTMRTILQAACSGIYFCIIYLLRPNWMALIIENRLNAEAFGYRSTQDKLPSELEKESDKLSPEVLETQHLLLAILSQGLAMLNCYSPPVGMLLAEEGLDISSWDKLLQPSFGSPSFENAGDTPMLSFGTLNTVASHFSRVLTRSDSSGMDRHKVTLVLEQALTLLVSQALTYLLDPQLKAQDKQLLKRELGAELGSVVENLRRQSQRGGKSPASARTTQIRQVTFTDQKFFHLISHIVDHVFK